MTKPKFNREKLKKALLSLDVKTVQSALGDPAAPDGNHAEACLDEFTTCGCAVVRHPAPPKLKARDATVTLIRTYLGAFPDHLATLDQHVGSARVVESYYHDILATLDKLEIAAFAPEIRAWASVDYASAGIAESLQMYAAQAKANTDPVVIKRQSITVESGRNVSVDGIVWSLTRGTGHILQMLDYQHDWFDPATGELVLPNRVPVEQSVSEKAGFIHYLGLAWDDLQRGWQRVRYFGGSMVSERRKLPFDNMPDPVEIELLEFGPPTKWELHDRIAISRLEQSLFQHAMDVSLYSKGVKFSKPTASAPIALPGPGNFVSLDELIAYHFLEEVLFLPIHEDTEHAEGLPLKAWLRGYAFLALSCPRDTNDQPRHDVVFFSRQLLIDGLVSVGFTADQAGKFIRLVTFGRTGRDLMDDPLVRLADDQYMLFAPGYHSPVLANIVTSRLGRFSTAFAERGRRFEKAVRTEFTNAGLKARSFKYKVDGVQYDCDVAVLWDGTLFVIECKNHTLPFGHLPSLKNFHQEFFHAAEQATRTMSHFEAHPDLVTHQFGAHAKWTRIVGCVLYATPWAIGRIVKDFDIYSYDASALGRFLRDGYVSVQSPRRHAEDVTVLRRHRHEMWKGKKPTAADFLRQLNDPVQVRMERAGRTVEALFRETARHRGIALPDWKAESLTPQQILESLGIEPDEAQGVAASFRGFHDAADRYDQRKRDLAGPAPKPAPQ